MGMKMKDVEVVSNRAAGMDLNWLENFPRY